MTSFTANDLIPANFWGKDHWSTLAYVNSVMTECAGFQVGLDARMRSNRRSIRVMSSDCPRPKRTKHTSIAAIATSDGSRLNDGQVVYNHDDWACVQDMAQAGLFTCHPDDVEPGTTLHFSEKGSAWANALTLFKQNGGAFSGFRAEQCPAMPECEPAVREEFVWLDTTIDVSKIRQDVATGKLKPKTLQFDAEFIAAFAETGLGMRKEKKDVPHGGTFFISASSERALSLPAAVLDEPIVCIYYKKGKGVLNLDGSLDHLLCDGNHRLARAYFDGKPSIDVLMLSAAQSRPYKR